MYCLKVARWFYFCEVMEMIEMELIACLMSPVTYTHTHTCVHAHIQCIQCIYLSYIHMYM